METLTRAVECGVAHFVLPGQRESGDHHVICQGREKVLVAAIDGVGHGKEAALAARSAAAILRSGVNESPLNVVQRCHEQLQATRGVVLSLASIEPGRGILTWLGIGNVQGVLMRAGAQPGTVQEVLLLRAGVVGFQLPALQAVVLPLQKGDTLVFATDGINQEFVRSLSALESPQRMAERILEQHHSGHDDGLVLVVRYTGTVG